MSGLESILVKDIGRLLTDFANHDLEIVAGEAPNTKAFKAHSAIVCARSPYFANVLLTVEPNKVGEHAVISKPNITPYVFSILLR